MYSRCFSLSRAGFTAIELLTVLVIIGICASIVTPSFGAYIDQMRTQRALDRLVTDIARTRVLAVEEGRPTAIRFQTDGTYTIETQATSGTWSVLQTVRLREEYPGISLVADVASLDFSSRGMVTNLTGDAFLKTSLHEARDSVYVSPAGRAYRAF